MTSQQLAAFAQLIPFVAIMLMITALIGSQIPKIVRAQRTYRRNMAALDLAFVKECAEAHQRAIAEGRISA